MTGRDKNRGKDEAAASGSGPAGRVELGDIKDKFDELRGEVDHTAEEARPLLTYAVVAGAVVVIAVAFLLGSRRGRRRSTWVEIKRQ